MLRAILVLSSVIAMAYSQGAGDAKMVNPPECGLANPKVATHDPTKIVGGNESDPHYYNWQISLMLRGSHRCGGSIINSQWIVCAAHCTGALYLITS